MASVHYRSIGVHSWHERRSFLGTNTAFSCAVLGGIALAGIALWSILGIAFNRVEMVLSNAISDGVCHTYCYRAQSDAGAGTGAKRHAHGSNHADTIPW